MYFIDISKYYIGIPMYFAEKSKHHAEISRHSMEHSKHDAGRSTSDAEPAATDAAFSTDCRSSVRKYLFFRTFVPAMTKKGKVLVGMSGGVDSSAVCMMLKDAGYEVVGMTMRVWDLPRHFSDGGDTPDFIRNARQLAGRLGIEHHVADVRERFRDIVVRNFIDEYRNGRTPNPCVLCNRDFKFRLLSEMADGLGCERIATGHYVKTTRHGAHTWLEMGDDVCKDQSYFLWRVPAATVARCLFPLGGMRKTDVRAWLAAHGQEVRAAQGESMEICFIEGDYRDFLREQCHELAAATDNGKFVDTSGRTLGYHRGVPFYTVGQRKGLGVALGQPAYVLRLNADKNTIVLGTAADLQATAFLAEEAVVVDEEEFFSTQHLGVRIRYHSRPVSCRAERMSDGRLLVRTSEPVSAVTPGQSAVFYIGQRLVGGAVIASQRGIGLLLS